MTFQVLVLIGLLGVLGACSTASERIANCQAQGNTREECTGNEQVLKDDIARTVVTPAQHQQPESPHTVSALQDAAVP